MPKAVALYSGGLDSLLSILVVKQQQIEISAFKFLTGFVSPLQEEDLLLADRFGFELKEMDVREKFINILKNPKHGYGKNLNPCIDCKIIMLKEAKELMNAYKASFVITGEVVSQRPMSQKKDILIHIEKEASLAGLIVRPLSAKLLPPSKPEIEGILDRESLYDIWGRGRKAQINLAYEFGLKKLPQPSGGCLLTDPLFCKKVRDLIEHEELTVENAELLKTGRHFRLSQKCKAIVGRDERENEILLNSKKGKLIYPFDFKGPVILILNDCSQEDMDKACAIGVYYSKKKENLMVIQDREKRTEKNYKAIDKEEILKYRI
ncbi:hypothetical protein [Thermodesulfovibrio sp.]|uniref:hypothetical protein n=1 Tax=Thermodesulfovibrio sp. TaxID=2067987 RepID=UPI0030ABAF9F